MTDRELMQQALEALDWAADYIEPRKPHNCDCPVCVASAALRERLAQPVQDGTCSHCDGAGCVACDARYLPQQEPVALETVYDTIIHWDEGGGKRSRRELARRIIALYTTPPRREWVGLTRAERFEIEKAMSQYYDYRHECKTVCLPEFAAAIEAKLKEKNA